MTKNPDKHRKKILEAIVFFSKKLRHPSKTVIFKVLAELDFKHFEQTGMSVTNLEYEAWKFGPVPRELYKEFTEGEELVIPADFRDALSCEKREFEDNEGNTRTQFIFHSKKKSDLKVFSPRQINIMEEVAFIYKEVDAKIATEASHEKDKPWTKTLKKYGKEGVVIDYFEQLTTKSAVNEEFAKEIREERIAFKHNLNG